MVQHFSNDLSIEDVKDLLGFPQIKCTVMLTVHWMEP